MMTMGTRPRAFVVLRTGNADVRLILDQFPAHWNAMASEDAKHQEVVTIEEKKDPGLDDEKQDEEEPKKRADTCLKILFVILGVVSVVVAIALIIVTILTSIATRAYDADQSSRIAAMVLLATSAAVTICMVIYLEVATFKKHSKPMVGAAAVILILAIAQALIGGISVNVTPEDEAKLVKSLAESFRLAIENNARHYKLWSMTQHDLSCCGMYSPEDYRSPAQPYQFPPDVPISCCPSYDPSRSDLVQDRDRLLCKSRKTFFTNGCKDLVLMVFNETATIVLAVTIILIICEILLLIVGLVLGKKLRLLHKNQVSPSDGQKE
ncbi:uncharacterized protein LOC142972191 isoform X2 [Anticarsia gemmatalis]|uniref:uncharacterized protein LOC142972191 isoform X2 n=1 Tax=Anticarsia gemmatalis TaxID=129554 RepID=UPI003F75FCB0